MRSGRMTTVSLWALAKSPIVLRFFAFAQNDNAVWFYLVILTLAEKSQKFTLCKEFRLRLNRVRRKDLQTYPMRASVYRLYSVKLADGIFPICALFQFELIHNSLLLRLNNHWFDWELSFYFTFNQNFSTHCVQFTWLARNACSIIIMKMRFFAFVLRLLGYIVRFFAPLRMTMRYDFSLSFWRLRKNLKIYFMQRISFASKSSTEHKFANVSSAGIFLPWV